eukprot:jgi/Mesvir1/19383/Mv10420-RA.1
MQDSDLEKAIALSLGGSGTSRDETLTPAKRSEAGGIVSEDGRRLLGRGSETGRRESEDDVARREREVRAAAAERRLQARINEQEAVRAGSQTEIAGSHAPTAAPAALPRNEAERLSSTTATVLWDIVFGRTPPAPSVVSQWTSQGFRFSSDARTSFGLVQRQGGPCGVLAPIQAFVLKYLLFHSLASSPSELVPFSPSTTGCLRIPTVSHEQQSAALVEAVAEVLWRCGGGSRATVATLSEDGLERAARDDGLADAGELLRAGDLPRLIRVQEAMSLPQLRHTLRGMLDVLGGGMGALLVLFSALLSRGLDMAETDRDDPGLPLVTPPFGHASQEIVNLLLCGKAVAHVFDGTMDMGSGLQLKGISGDIEVGFLTQLEFLHYCKVGDLLKNPKYPIWVVGSESHYSVLFGLSNAVQDDSKEDMRMKEVRAAFNACDMSGTGGGFISSASLDDILAKVCVQLADDELATLRRDEVVTWQDFWEVVRRHDAAKAAGGSSQPHQQQIVVAGAQPGVPTGWGAPAQTAPPDQRWPPAQAPTTAATPAANRGQQFRLYHFNGIAKSWDSSGGAVSSLHAAGGGASGACDASGGLAGEDARGNQRPHLVELSVSVPPRWNGDLSALDIPLPPLLPLSDSLVDDAASPQGNGQGTGASGEEMGMGTQAPAPTPQAAPLVECIRTRWPGAQCAWAGTAPSIV